MRVLVFFVILGGCSTPQQKCDKLLDEYQRKAENCGINVGSLFPEKTFAAEACKVEPEKFVAENKVLFGSVFEADNCTAMKVRWERLTEEMTRKAREARRLEDIRNMDPSPSKEFDEAFKKALEEASRRK